MGIENGKINYTNQQDIVCSVICVPHAELSSTFYQEYENPANFQNFE